MLHDSFAQSCAGLLGSGFAHRILWNSMFKKRKNKEKEKNG